MLPHTSVTCSNRRGFGRESQKGVEGQKSRVTVKAENDSKQQRNRTKKNAGAVKTEVSVLWTRSITIHPGESAWRPYQTAPHWRFPNELVRAVMKSTVDARLGRLEYTASCSAVATELSDSIKDAAKRLSYERYKLVSYVAIGQLRDSDVTCSSRGVWCPAADTFTEYVFKNEHLFALCVLFAVYQE
ncbi:hypothetical protein AOLI_G00149420 [Acnodon oligacanthus]